MAKMDPLKSYRETQIRTATQGKLILMLYDGAVQNINLALEALKEKHRKYDAINRYLLKTQDIITELMVSLDLEKGGDIARNLFNLYLFINRSLIEANLNKDGPLLQNIKRMLLDLRASWSEVAGKKTAEASLNSGRVGGVNIAG